jgi:hypothetical protein
MIKEGQQLRFGGEFNPAIPKTPINQTGINPSISPDISRPFSEKGAWRKLPPTDGQRVFITRMCLALGIKEPIEEKVSNRMEARSAIVELKEKLRVAKLKRKSG